MNAPSVVSGYGSASTKRSSLIHFAPLTIIGNEECTKKHYDNLEASNSEIDKALREQVKLILDSQKKISSQIVCTRAPIEDLGTCPGGYKIKKTLNMFLNRIYKSVFQNFIFVSLFQSVFVNREVALFTLGMSIPELNYLLYYYGKTGLEVKDREMNA